MTTKQLPATLTVQRAGDTPAITITTPAVDLQRDTIDPMGMDIERYLQGTRAVHWAHDYHRLPVGKTLSLVKTPQGIRATFTWLANDEEAQKVRNAFEQNVLGASVGFVVPDEGRTANRHGGMHFARSVLAEWSLTSNPANPTCVRTLKSLGLVREDAPVVVVRDDDDDVIRFEERDLALAIREVMEQRIRAAVRRQTRHWPGLAPSSPVVLVETAQGEVCEVSLDTIRDATTAALQAHVAHTVRTAVNALTGRID